MSDSVSEVYRYSWDVEDLKTYPWTHHYLKQPDVLAYLKHIVKKHDLRKDMQFETEMLSADWDDESNIWRVRLSTGGTLSVRYLITALGLLSKTNFPQIKGMESFGGELCHTGMWKSELDLTNKRVGVIGCGSTGVQIITEVAKDVKTLVCFQRRPQYSVPSGDGPVSPEYRKNINDNYEALMAHVKNSATGMGFEESTTPYESVPPEDREQVFEDLWAKGNGFRFML